MAEPRLLVVDRDPVQRASLVQALRRSGYRITEATDAHSAFRALLDANPAGVLVGEGTEAAERAAALRLCRQLRALPGCDHLVLLLLSAGGAREGEAATQAFAAGVTDFVSRPVVFPVLENRLRELLRARETARALERSERRLVRAQRAARLGDWRLQVDGDVLSCSPEMLRILGRSVQDAPASLQELIGCVHPEDASMVGDALTDALERGTSFNFECRIASRDGSVRTVHLGGELERVGPRQDLELAGSLRDLTDQRSQQAQLRYLAYYDQVTRLPNGTQFDNIVRRHTGRPTCPRTRPFALIALQVDNLGTLTEPLTRLGGDTLMRALTERFQEAIGECMGDGLGVRSRARARARRDRLARTSPSVFTVLLEGVADKERALELAERLRTGAQQAVSVDGKFVHPRISAASVVFPADAQDADGLRRALDATLTAAARAGGGCARAFEPAITRQIRHKASIEARLREVLAEDALVLHYQPRVNCRRQITGAEALVRMRGEDGTLIPPGEFIPLAEELGLITELGRCVANAAIRQLRSWQSLGLVDRQFVMSVNVSPRQFEQPRFFEELGLMLQNQRVAPACLELEITEDALMTDATAAGRLAEARRELGLRIAIDDYGSGYSSLNYLRDLPADTLKIDRSFVRGLGDNQTDELIIQFTTQLAQALGMRVCAEGVESALQLELLQRLGCDEVQGYLFGRPVDARAFGRGLMASLARQYASFDEAVTAGVKGAASTADGDKADGAGDDTGLVLLEAAAVEATRSASG